MKFFAPDGKLYFFPAKSALEMTNVWLTKDRAIEVYYLLSAYIKSADDVRRIASLIGLKRFDKVLSNEAYILDDALTETLFRSLKTDYFISKDAKILFASTFETDQRRHGPLQPVSAINALKKYGAKALDEAVERGMAAINGSNG